MLVVVGGHARKIGKTSVLAGLIRATRHRDWTAMKISHYGNGVRLSGEECPEFAIREESEAGDRDSGRFLAAGAKRSLWLRVPAGEMARAAEMVKTIVAQGTNVIVESNGLLDVVAPDVCLMVLDFGEDEFKASSRRFMDHADGFVMIDRGSRVPPWEEMVRGMMDGKPKFRVMPPYYVAAEIVEFVESRLAAGATG